MTRVFQSDSHPGRGMLFGHAWKPTDFVVSAIFVFGLVWRGVANAADSSSTEFDYPLVVVNAASIERIRENAGTMFESADRKDMTDRVDQWMASSLNETKGIDRTRPFGIMMYLRPELFGPPIGISYLPVSNLNDALETMSGGVATVSPVEGKQDQHEIQITENFKLRTLYRHGYLFVVGPDGNDTSLDRDFPDPEKLTARLTAQYDIAVSLMINSIPVGIKTLVMSYFKNQSQADLQQRDDEPESVYRLRRANGEFWIELIEKIVNQGNEVSLGGRMNVETKSAFVELEVAGTRDSKLAKFFQKMAGKRTYFGNLLDNPATLTASLSLSLDENQRKLFSIYFDAARRDLLAKFDDEVEKSDFLKIVDPLFKTLHMTADVGHIDVLFQLTGTEQGQFALLGGVKLATYREMPAKIQEIVEFLADSDANNGILSKFEFEFEAIDSFPVHRLPVQIGEARGKHVFGKNAFLHLYASPDAVWGSFGGDAAMQVLKEAVQQVALPGDPAQDRNRVPFQVSMHARNWLALADEDSDEDSFVNRAEDSFSSDNDAMIVEVRPTDTGVRIRTEFQSGFIALMGRNFANGIEKGFFQPGRRGNQQGAARNKPQPDPADDDDGPEN